MNTNVESAYVERIHRLALGLEPWDAVRGGRVTHPVRVDIESRRPWRHRHPKEPYGLGRGRRWWPPRPGAYPVRLYPRNPHPFFSRHDSCLHILLYTPDLNEKKYINLRIYDHDRRYTPRRLRVPLLTLKEVLVQEDDESLHHVEFWERLNHRVRRPVLFPGAAYDISERVTGLRGRVVRDGKPMRWARLEAHLPESHVLVGRTHGDNRGEFLLLLEPRAAPFTELTDPLQVRVTVSGPAVTPSPESPETSDQDYLWDLPLEELPDPGEPDPVSAGDTFPDGYAAAFSASRIVSFRLGRISSGLEKFVYA